MSDFETAVQAYKDHCDKTGDTFQQPSEELSNNLQGVIYLRVGPGYVARYNIKRGQLNN